ncbi:MAG: hypothetical protein GQ564_12370 [Bacteroidales bacterium]|nr:hypothetical protein [Bacteroidales bacterium]
MLNILSIFLSGLFGVIIAITTWKLSLLRERNNRNIELNQKEYERHEDFFISCLASFDKVIRYTKSNRDYSELISEHSIFFARSRLFENKAIGEKLDSASYVLSEWTFEYKKSMPKQVGDTNYAIISNLDSEHSEKAKELFDKASKEINELVDLMKGELEKISLK